MRLTHDLLSYKICIFQFKRYVLQLKTISIVNIEKMNRPKKSYCLLICKFSLQNLKMSLFTFNNIFVSFSVRRGLAKNKTKPQASEDTPIPVPNLDDFYDQIDEECQICGMNLSAADRAYAIGVLDEEFGGRLFPIIYHENIWHDYPELVKYSKTLEIVTAIETFALAIILGLALIYCLMKE